MQTNHKTCHCEPVCFASPERGGVAGVCAGDGGVWRGNPFFFKNPCFQAAYMFRGTVFYAYQMLMRFSGGRYMPSVSVTPKASYHSGKFLGCMLARRTVGE